MTMNWIIDEKRNAFLLSKGHILVLGGPGSGKTTISLIKGTKIIDSPEWSSSQKVLFLSFARATVARVIEHLQNIIPMQKKNCFEISTYHGFCWKLLKSHGYLLSQKKLIQTLDPSIESANLAHIADENRMAHLKVLFEKEGILGFDLFAHYASELLESKKFQNLISKKYPVIIVDEFQDTNSDEWRFIQLLGKNSQIIALADPDQRIYEFRGADPARAGEFSSVFSPKTFDFESENNRSAGTDIVDFGNDLLLGKNQSKVYNDVKVIKYKYYKDPFFILKTHVLSAIDRLKKLNQENWSIAVLVPTKVLMAGASDYFLSNESGLPKIFHEVAVDHEGPSLAALLIATLLEGKSNLKDLEKEIADRLMDHMRGRTGRAPAKSTIDTSDAISKHFKTGEKTRGKKREALAFAIRQVASSRMSIKLTGNPSKDWITMLEIIHTANKDIFKNVLSDIRFSSYLTRGSNLRHRLTEEWKNTKSYRGALNAFKLAMQQEHFTASAKKRVGVNIMTIHKSKGKEFDEVVIYEATYQRFIHNISDKKSVEQSRLMLRVAVTRAMKRATILTPIKDSCPLL